MRQLKSISLVLFLQLIFCAIALGLTITMQPYGAPNVSTFDPSSPPPGLDDYEADAECSFDLDADPPANGYDLGCSKDGKQVSVSNMRITVSAQTDIRLPTDADQDLIDHENGHHDLFKYEFENFVKQKIADKFKDFEGIRDVPAGKTCQDVANEIESDFNDKMDELKEAIQQQLDELSDRYDANDLTDHSRNESITAQEAVDKVKKERADAEAKKAGSGSQVAPDNRPGKQKVTGTGAVYDANDVIMWSPVRANIENLTIPADTINTRGLLEVLKLIIIGPEKRGVIRCADSHLRMIDIVEPQMPFFEAGLYEVRILPSSVPGYAQMIQAYLNIWKIDNRINSDFLAFMEQQQASEQYTSFWFYAVEPLVDSTGQWIAAGQVNGQFVLGTAADSTRQAIDDFEDYDPLTFPAAWIPAGGGIPMLDPIASRSGLQGMRLEIHNPVPMAFSQATRVFAAPQNFAGAGKTLNLYVKSMLPPHRQLNDLYVAIRDTGNQTGRFEMDDPGTYGAVQIFSPNTEWIGVSMDMRAFTPQVNTMEIIALDIGFQSDTEPLEGFVMIDDITLAEQIKTVEPVGDLDGDYQVNLVDLAILAENWMNQGIWPVYP
jgi:hypothetical protein